MSGSDLIDIYNDDDWTVVVLNGSRFYSGHDRISQAAKALLIRMGADVTVRFGVFGTDNNGDDTKFLDDFGVEHKVP